MNKLPSRLRSAFALFDHPAFAKRLCNSAAAVVRERAFFNRIGAMMNACAMRGLLDHASILRGVLKVAEDVVYAPKSEAPKRFRELNDKISQMKTRFEEWAVDEASMAALRETEGTRTAMAIWRDAVLHGEAVKSTGMFACDVPDEPKERASHHVARWCAELAAARAKPEESKAAEAQEIIEE